MKAILGKKMMMSQVFRDDGTVWPVTKVAAGPCVITQVKTKEKDGVAAVQIGFASSRNLAKPQLGHLKGLAPMRFLRDIQPEKIGENITRGAIITVKTFAPGDMVEVIGTSKGKGFAGVVKRHHFAGGPASHGHKDNLRAPGAIGAGGVQRVFKGVRMAGRMGGERVTIKNLEVVAIDAEKNELLLKGAVPGAFGSLLIIKGPGELQVEVAPQAETAPEAASAEEVVSAAPEQTVPPSV
ncbi:MAG: ribosomal protein L3 [Candidatus Magasanikbacteria bacterium]|nr:ribosomal protein L3 [Candidatus Magasanikbacteria bacterium]